MYLSCRYPPGLYLFNTVDTLGRASSTWAFNLQDIGVTIAAPTSPQAAFVNESFGVSWLGSPAPLATSPEFARLQLLQECTGLPAGAAAPAPQPRPSAAGGSATAVSAHY